MNTSGERNSKSKKISIGRREFLKAISVAATGLTLAPVLNSCAVSQSARESREVNFNAQLNVLRSLLGFAILAPSGHNTQPWKFKLESDTIYIYPDYTRRLPVVDPDNRELFISLGCAIENLVIASEAAGFAPDISYDFLDTNGYIILRFSNDTPRKKDKLLNAIKTRQCTRNEYNYKQIPSEDLTKIESVEHETGINSIIITDKKQTDNIIELVKAGNDLQMNDDAFYDELQSWIRFSEGEASEKADGLYSACMGNPSVPRWIGKIFMDLFYGADSQSKDDATRIKSSSGIVLFTSNGKDKISWIKTGRTYERWALAATIMNVKSAFINQPVEIASLKTQLSSYLNTGNDIPQLLLRFGYAETLPYSYRRKVDSVLV